jgi:DNA-binding protein HU-beta
LKAVGNVAVTADSTGGGYIRCPICDDGVDDGPVPCHPLSSNPKGVEFMNKTDLTSKVAELSGLTKAHAEKAVDATLSAITSALKGGDDVRLVGFGSFSVASRPQREGKNPRTGQKITIPAAKQPKFSPGKALKDTVNG